VDRTQELRGEILRLVSEYCTEAFPVRGFVPGSSRVPVSGRVFDATELEYLVDASLDFWLTTGRFAEQFERQFALFLGLQSAVLCNSGSSANLLAVTALTSPKLKDRALRPGNEVITVAAGFPTTVAPIVQNRLIPVFIDVQLGTYNLDASLLEAALSPRTRAVIAAHTMGNPFDLTAVCNFAKRHDLWVIEDNCDALGARYGGQLTGTFGDLATFSFYPAHHITMGEGGCVAMAKPDLKVLVESFRDWGRDCWCDPGKDNTCGKRFQWQIGGLPFGYDHKYAYSHLGYNLKLTDMQAAVGLAQLQKLPQFMERRKRNWQILYEGLKPLEKFLILPVATPNSDPSWFGFLITVRPGAPFSRTDLIQHLEDRKIATRLLFGGNLTRQPAFQGVAYRQAGELKNTDLIMDGTFWIGVYPGLTEDMLGYVVETIVSFVARRLACPSGGRR